MKRINERSKMLHILIVVCGAILLSTNGNAATITTLLGGSWEVGAIWDSGVPPTSADDVVITSGNNVTLTSNVTVASLVVNSEDLTVFTINSGYTLTITGDVTIYGSPDATSSQIACNGNVIIGGNLIFEGDASNAQAQLSMGDGSTAILSGSIVFTGFGRVWSGSTANVHTFTFNGSGDRDIKFTGNRYHHLIFNTGGNITALSNLTSTAVYGTIDIVSGTFKNNGYSLSGVAGKTFTIRTGSTLQLSGTFGLPSNFNMVVESGSNIHFSGSSQTVGVLNNSQNYANLQISGTGTKTLAGNTTVRGNLTITASTLDVHSTNNYSLSVAGNFSNSATFNARAGAVTFNGTTAQDITSGGSTFYNVTFNNASGFTLNDDMTVTNVVTLSNGKISTGANRLVVESTDPAAIVGYSSSNFINGRLRRYMTTNTSTYAFPVGNSTLSSGYHLAELINNSMTGLSYMDARFGALTNHNDADLSVSDSYMTYLSVAPVGVWHLTPNAQPSGGSYDVRLSTANMGVLSNNQFAIVKRDDGSTSGADWGAPGTVNNDNGAGRMVADGYAIRFGLTTFSEFGLGRASNNGNPLPIELVSFTAKVNATNEVVLDWITAIEINNDFFTIERSTDGVNFEEVTRVNGAGSSNVSHNYSTLDENPENGLSYYRLKQTDFDGAFEYSSITSVVVGGAAQPTVQISVYPNPANAGQQIQVNISEAKIDYTIEVYEIGSGKLIYKGLSIAQQNRLDMPEGLAAGAYLVRVSNDTEVQNQKLFVR
jgi:hypothetical protein